MSTSTCPTSTPATRRALDGGSQRDAQIGIDFPMQLVVQLLAQQLLDQWRARAASHEHDAVDLAGVHVRVRQRGVHAQERLAEQRLDQRLVVGAIDVHVQIQWCARPVPR